MEKEKKDLQMGILMSGNIEKENQREKENIPGMMEVSMKENLREEFGKGKED